MSTSSINFTSTDKMNVFAGVRKLSDAAAGMIAELSASTGTNNGAFLLAAPVTAAANYGWNARGVNLNATLAPTGFAAPISNVLTGTGNISGDLMTIRVNGTQAAQSTDDQGTSTFGNYPIYIGARAGSSIFFSGHLYSLIARFGPNLDTGQISSTETWVASRTGITI
jgi:hypothetical protein